MQEWLDLATHLHMDLSTVMARTTSRQFVLWRVYLDALPNRFNPTHQYLAQIAAEVEGARFKEPTTPKDIAAKALQFTERYKSKEPPKEKKPKLYTPQQIAAMQSVWMVRVGVKPHGSEKRP